MQDKALALWRSKYDKGKEVGIIDKRYSYKEYIGFVTLLWHDEGENGHDRPESFTLLAPKVLTSWEE